MNTPKDRFDLAAEFLKSIIASGYLNAHAGTTERANEMVEAAVDAALMLADLLIEKSFPLKEVTPGKAKWASYITSTELAANAVKSE